MSTPLLIKYVAFHQCNKRKLTDSETLMGMYFNQVMLCSYEVVFNKIV